MTVNSWSRVALILSGILAGISALVGIGLFLDAIFNLFNCVATRNFELCISSTILLLSYLVLVGPFFVVRHFHKRAQYGLTLILSAFYFPVIVAFLMFAIFVGIVV